MTTHTITPHETVPWGAVVVFVIASMGLAWLVALPLWIVDPTLPGYQMLFTMLAVAMMFTPAIATLCVVFFMKQPPTERMRFLGMWPMRPAKRVIWFTAFATTVPLVIVLAVTFVSAVLGLVELDLRTFAGFAETIRAALPAESADLGGVLPIRLLVIVQLLTVPFAAIVNSIPAFGEEIGWRGWLLPALRPLGTWPALLLTGIVWGLWHSPLVLLGYNFGLTDWRGVALMTGGCVAWGVLLGWSRLRSGSVWPAVVGHGGLNAAAGVVVLFAADASTVDMAVVGPLGVVSWACIAILVIVIAVAGAFRRQPPLALSARAHSA